MRTDLDDRIAALLPQDASPRLRTMAQAALLAGDGLLQAAQSKGTLTIEEKSEGDFVSEADEAAEALIAAHLKAAFPGYGWLGEESDEQASTVDGLRWIVDPLDGTTNFLKGLPHWAVSIALYQRDVPLCAIVHDPAKGETFSAEKGCGAYLNGQRIYANQNVARSAQLLATGVPNGARVTYLPHCLRDLDQLMPQSAGIRRWGAAALDLAYVAAGRIDAYWERNLGPWDIAAGVLLVEEAGAAVLPLWPGTPLLTSGSFVAGHESVIGPLLSTLDRNPT